MTIIIGMTLGIMGGMDTAHIGMEVRTGMQAGGTIRGMTLGSMVGIVRGDGIILGTDLFITIGHIMELQVLPTMEDRIVPEA